MSNEREKVDIGVPAGQKDEKKNAKEEEEGEEERRKKRLLMSGNIEDPKNTNDTLSPEDKELKERLELYVERIQDIDDNISLQALKLLKEEIRTSTSSMTSVPKPLKFLKNHYNTIKSYYNKLLSLSSSSSSSPSLSTKNLEFADLMSILAMTMEDPSTKQCLKYRLQSDINNLESWGSLYVKHLVAEIVMEQEQRIKYSDNQEILNQLIPFNQILLISKKIVKYYMDHHSEPDACDLLLEIERLDLIKKFCGKDNYNRVCEYLRSCAQYYPYPDDINIYKICYDLYYNNKSYYHALRFALKLDNKLLVKKVMKIIQDKPIMKRQLAYLLGWHQYQFNENDLEDNDENEQDGNQDNHDIENEDLDIDMVDKTGKNENANNIKDDKNEKKEDIDLDILLEENIEDESLLSINDIISNSQLSESFKGLAKDLDVLEPKDPELDIFKEQLLENDNTTTSTTSTVVISARKSLAKTYVNAFVNAGYGTDKYMCNGITNANSWITKNKEHGQMAAVGSVGMIMLWDEDAVNNVVRYFESDQNYIRAGGYLAIGLACSGMRSETDIGYALLHEPASVEGKKTLPERIAATFGLGLAYAGQSNEQVWDVLGPLVSNDENVELSCIAALSLGLIYIGTCNDDIINLILTDLLEKTEEQLNNSLYLFNALGLGLLFLQKGEEVETTLEAVEALSDINIKYCKTLKTTLECLAYTGTGNVIKIQQLLDTIGEHYDDEVPEDKEDKDENSNPSGANGLGGLGSTSQGGQNNTNDDDEKDKKEKETYRYYQSIAVIGLSLITSGEDLGSDMALRMFNHLIQYGNQRVKRAVPLGLALLYVSNPKMEVSDILSRLTHDHDNIVAQNAIFSLGMIGAGSNNARISSMLRQLTMYYSKEANHLFLIRIAQGLIHMGKGLMTLQPYHSDRFLISKVALSGILTCLFSCIDINNTILGSKHYLLYSLVLAIKPRMLITLNNESLQPIKTSVRVGIALDIVGQAGKPKTITGFQTHDTPVLLGYRDRAELATDNFISYTPILEGFAILKKNPYSDANKKTSTK